MDTEIVVSALLMLEFKNPHEVHKSVVYSTNICNTSTETDDHDSPENDSDIYESPENDSDDSSEWEYETKISVPKHPRNFNDKERNYLITKYNLNHHPPKIDMMKMAKKLGVTYKRIYDWFKDHRYRSKKKLKK